ncbi:hypothetical protein NW763_009786 [Fusarium oxysporum]|nr:hypothetical protein NW763_009786 [Fusarium oxysporum]
MAGTWSFLRQWLFISRCPLSNHRPGSEQYPRNREYAQGGQFAGLRLHLKTQEVEFRPLTWDEVEPIGHRQIQPQQGRKLPDDQDPEFVARV